MQKQKAVPDLVLCRFETFAAEISQSKEAIIPVLEELGFKK
ncbi:MAG: hypothetical protein ACLR3S_09655 [Clostridium fessum]